MKLGQATQIFTEACQRHGISGDTREGKGRHYFRLKGKRVMTFEFRPYRWVFFRFEREAFLAAADTGAITKAPSPHEPGPTPCAVFTGTLPADDAALAQLIDRFVAAVADGRLQPVAKEAATEAGAEPEVAGTAPNPKTVATTDVAPATESVTASAETAAD